jgi:hypothetical protein
LIIFPSSHCSPASIIQFPQIEDHVPVEQLSSLTQRYDATALQVLIRGHILQTTGSPVFLTRSASPTRAINHAAKEALMEVPLFCSYPPSLLVDKRSLHGALISTQSPYELNETFPSH